jgi:hypothetical protein
MLGPAMLFNLNLLHLLLVLGAAGCVRLALREIRGRSMSLSRLFMLPLLAMVMAFIFLLFFLASQQPVWMFVAALVLGLLAGAARGITMALQFDQTWRLVRPTGRRVLLWVALLLAAAVAVELAGGIAGPAGALWRVAAAETAALCAGMFTGRAVAVAIRTTHLPHDELRR